ncbi:helix-turn-helix domain-containing protein [uncultured Jatrophihabitans sp.]|uniref:helix-turn-helix domain-containing protein n=1 Tax=uncultured Jatrophihabitans sp. TaxID=1610747 RepID=UPI0035CAB6EE
MEETSGAGDAGQAGDTEPAGERDQTSETGSTDKQETMLGRFPLSGLVRRVRRTADLSQRELARHAKVSAATVAHIEKGAMSPSLDVLQRILHAANFEIVVVDPSGRLVIPLEVWRDIGDLAGRRFPAHLDTILDPKYGEWWADVYGLTSPPETFRRDRAYRDHLRLLSRWEVRVARYRHAPKPTWPRGRKPDWEDQRGLPG